MINRICNSVNFGSTIVNNSAYNNGIKKTKYDLKQNNDLFSINSFVNAVNYIKNDGRDDVYEVVYKKSKGNIKADVYHLFKNGQIVQSEKGGDFVGEKIRSLFIKEAFDNIGFDVFDISSKNFKRFWNAYSAKDTNGKNIKLLNQKMEILEDKINRKRTLIDKCEIEINKRYREIDEYKAEINASDKKIDKYENEIDKLDKKICELKNLTAYENLESSKALEPAKTELKERLNKII